MIIEDLNVSRACICPTKAHSVLFIDSDTELTPPTPGKGLEAVSRWNPQIIECFNGIKLVEFASRDGPEALGAGASGRLCRNAVEEVLGSPIRE